MRNLVKQTCQQSFTTYFLLVTLVIAIAIRVSLSYVNRASNDNHIEVAQQLIEFHEGTRIASEIQCRECFHPKFFHYAIASIYYLFEINNENSRIIFAQYINTFCGVLTLIIIWLFLNKINSNPTPKIITFLLFAFNPSIIFMNVQATNDSLVVFFCVLSSYMFYLHTASSKYSYLVISLLSMLCGIFTKGTALPTLIWANLICISYLTIGVYQKSITIKKVFIYAIFLILPIVVMLFTPQPFSNYVSYFNNAVQQKSLGASHFQAAPLPEFTNRNYNGRPGVISVFDSFLTFRWFDLIQNPYITNNAPPVPFHRTSLWSQIYGRFHFSYFSQWGWARIDTLTIFLGRMIMIVALLPTLIFIFGFIKLAQEPFMNNKSNNNLYLKTHLFAPLVLLYFIFIILFSIAWGGFEAMKDIYIFPGLLAYVACFSCGLSFLQSKSKAYQIFSNISCIFLIILYLLNNLLVIGHLYS
jgi:Dolichyl-phosphate-mannose-protein mannosyltransferase